MIYDIVISDQTEIDLRGIFEVVSWWICFSVGLNLMYHSCCNNNYY